MGPYALRRVLLLVPTLFGVSVLAFLLSNLTPGDPAEVYITRITGNPASLAQIARARHQLGLDRPIPVRYLSWLSDAAHGDLGLSYSTHESVSHEVLRRVPYTLQLALPAALLAVLIAVPAGIICAVKRNRVVDQVVRIVSLAGASLPSFWLALILIVIFAVKLHMFPVAGRGGLDALVLPVITLALSPAATLTRFIRSAVLEALSSDYVVTARAKGLRESLVVSRHALRNSLVPIVTAFGNSLGYMFAGAAVIETIFVWPGVGKLLVDAILQRDYPMIEGFILYVGLAYATVNLVIDLSYAAIDPRISLVGGAAVTLTGTPIEQMEAPEELTIPVPVGSGREIVRAMLRDRTAVLGLTLVSSLVLAAVFASVLAPHDPNAVDVARRFAAPSLRNPLGTDHLGRDVLSRVLFGGRLSIGSAIVAAGGTAAIGLVVGMAAGYFGGIVDTIISRVLDVILAFPIFLLAMAITGILGVGLRNIIIALIVASWAWYARIVRAAVLAEKNKAYVEAARAAGASNLRVIFRHLLPNIIAPVIVWTTVDTGQLLLAISSLSFLGLGVKPPAAEWGAMLSEGRSYLDHGLQMMIFPGLAIFLTVLGLNLLGDGLRDSLDPRTRRVRHGGPTLSRGVLLLTRPGKSRARAHDSTT